MLQRSVAPRAAKPVAKRSPDPEFRAIPMGLMFVAERFAPIVGRTNKARLLPIAGPQGGLS